MHCVNFLLLAVALVCLCVSVASSATAVTITHRSERETESHSNSGSESTERELREHSPTYAPTVSPSFDAFCRTMSFSDAAKDTSTPSLSHSEMCSACVKAGCLWCESSSLCFAMQRATEGACPLLHDGEDGDKSCSAKDEDDQFLSPSMMRLVIVLACVVPLSCVGCWLAVRCGSKCKVCGHTLCRRGDKSNSEKATVCHAEEVLSKEDIVFAHVSISVSVTESENEMEGESARRGVNPHFVADDRGDDGIELGVGAVSVAEPVGARGSSNNAPSAPRL